MAAGADAGGLHAATETAYWQGPAMTDSSRVETIRTSDHAHERAAPSAQSAPRRNRFWLSSD